MGETSGIASALGDFATVMTNVASIITGNPIIFTMFAGGLLVVGAKVFKKIKNSVK